MESNLAGFQKSSEQQDDGEADDYDSEPSLGTLGSNNGDQSGWGALCDGALDAEAEHDGREPSMCGIHAAGHSATTATSKTASRPANSKEESATSMGSWSSATATRAAARVASLGTSPSAIGIPIAARRLGPAGVIQRTTALIQISRACITACKDAPTASQNGT